MKGDLFRRRNDLNCDTLARRACNSLVCIFGTNDDDDDDDDNNNNNNNNSCNENNNKDVRDLDEILLWGGGSIKK
jgi:hypothetical protein